MKGKKPYNKILVLFCIIVVSVLMTGCDGDDEPIVLFFFALPITINQGESSTLTWGVSKADTVSITPGVGTVASSGSISVSPGVNTEYTLIATNNAGSVSATATVNVQAISLLPVHNITKKTYYNTIQAALNDADSNDTIEVADGIYDETIGFPSFKKVILQSVNGPSSTTIQGDLNSSTVGLSNSLPGTTIKGFTITHAVGLMGGGIFNYVGNLTIYNCTISGNAATYGGGGIENSGTLTITGASTISGNTASHSGGGIFNLGTLTIEGESTISDNTAYWGGGIYNFYGTLAITASTISGNSANWGGGMYISVGSSIPTIGGSSSAKKNTICGNYKSGNDPSLDQQIRGNSGDLYNAYKDTNYIGIYCPIII